jgi:hypothetical protein
MVKHQERAGHESGSTNRDESITPTVVTAYAGCAAASSPTSWQENKSPDAGIGAFHIYVLKLFDNVPSRTR